MRIAMISEHASPIATLGGVDAGGQNVHVAALARHLSLRGHDVSVYTRRDRPLDDLPERVQLGDGVTVVNVPVGPASVLPKDDLLPLMPAFADWMQEDWARHGRPDVMHTHFWMSGLAAMQAADATGIPMVQTFHALGTVKRRHQGAEDTSPASRIADEARVAGRADAIIATCSDEVTELERAGVDTSRTHVVPCGVDTTLFRPGDDPVRSGAGPLLLSVARLVPRKGIETVIRALAHLPTARLLVIGGPPAAQLDSDAEVKRLLTVADSLGVAGRLRFAGSVPHEKMPSAYQAADVVVASPWYEPFGITPVEAAACGRPVVGTAVGGLLDTVVNGETGLLVPPRNPPALAEAIARITSSPRLSRIWGVRAAELAHDRYAWSRIAERTEAVFRDTTSRATTVGAVSR